MEHELKIWPSLYHDTVSGRKQFEIRRNDRGFTVGDTLLLREYTPTTGLYSGFQILVTVTYLMDLEPWLPGWVAMGISVVKPQ